MSSTHDTSASIQTGGRARRTLGDLRRCWGKLRVTEGTEAEPRIIERRSMGDCEVWKHLHGKGSGAVFELQRGD